MTTSTDGPDLMSEELILDPERGWGRLRERAAVVRGTYMGQAPAWYVTRFAEVRAVLDDPRFVNDPASVPGLDVPDASRQVMRAYGIDETDARLLTRSIVRSDPPDHTRLRKLVSRAFTVRRVGELRPRVEAITTGLLDRLGGRPEPVDLLEEFCYPLPITVICELVGVPEADRSAWRDMGRELVSLDPQRFPVALRALFATARGLIGTRRADPADDLLSDLIAVRDTDGDRLSEHELVTFVITLVMAGHETTAHLIGNSVVLLLERPDQSALLREQPELWSNAVHELLRCGGIALVASPRYAAEDVELGGVRVAKGDMVIASLAGANFDPRHYADPDRFDVTRRPEGRGEPHTSFGHGIHYCLGAALARQEVEVALRALFARFPALRLAAAPTRQPTPGSRRLAALTVSLRPES